jgi:AcrR family transcriptional regulator
VSYYFPGKRQLVQSAVHRLMHGTLAEALEREPRTDDRRERMARAIDAILGLARDHPLLMRHHMAGILQGEGFVQCPEQRRLAELLRETVARHGSPDPDTDYPMLRALLMGAVFASLVPGVPMQLPVLRAELFRRYELDWEQGTPPDPEGGAGGGRASACAADLSRFFGMASRAPEADDTPGEGSADGRRHSRAPGRDQPK